MLYFAYGSNLSLRAMARRCPRAVPLGKFVLADCRLVFRGVADAIYEPGAKCYGGLWRITPACEVALDRYEGIGSGMYRKDYVPLEGRADGETELMLYAMNSTGIMPPCQSYLGVIQEGYRDFKLPLKHLRDAVAASWDDKAPSHIERKRRRRDGRPPLADPNSVRLRAVKTGKPTTGNLFGEKWSV